MYVLVYLQMRDITWKFIVYTVEFVCSKEIDEDLTVFR